LVSPCQSQKCLLGNVFGFADISEHLVGEICPGTGGGCATPH
jgi:hypothetical protein